MQEIHGGCIHTIEVPPLPLVLSFIDIQPLLLYSNSNKVVKKKIDGEWEYHVIHWKTDTIKSMYERCCIQYPLVANCKVKYFAKFIPWYVRNKPNYSGLCWKHDLGIFFSTLLKTRRTQWHLDCECDCTSVLIVIMARIQMKVSVIMEPARDAWTASVQLNTLKMNKVKEKRNSNGLEIGIHPLSPPQKYGLTGHT